MSHLIMPSSWARREWPAQPAPTRSRAETAEQFDSLAGRWDTEHGPASTRASEFAERMRYLRACCRAGGQPRVLDLGCGTGQTLLHLLGEISMGVGVDISSRMIACARQNTAGTSLRFFVNDAADFCMHSDERFDLVLCIGTLEHLCDCGAALAGAARVLAHSGRAIVISPHPWNPLLWLKRITSAGHPEPACRHRSPVRLSWLGRRSGLKLSAVAALRYEAFPRPGARRGESRPGSNRSGSGAPFTGMLRGAFAAEFCRS